MSDSVLGSKEIAIFAITVILQQSLKATGIDFPLTPEQIYASGLAIMAIVRVLWTDGKITSFLPKKGKTDPHDAAN